jgi:hypothetical protein
VTPENRELSPYTGWTRAHWEAAADRTLAAVRPYASPGHALIDLPGPVSSSGRRSDGLEGFARTFLAAGFRLAQSSDGSLAGWYARGLAAGTDPASPERWPRVTEVNQAKVEAASIALALHESRHVLWDALDDGVRERVVAWLAETIGQPYPQCNWLWFQNITQAFLRSVGGPWSAEEIERNIATMEGWYLGDGWYTDGPVRKFDWYAGWAMNFYPLWYGRMTGEPDGTHRDRLREYLTGVQHLYAPDGAPLHQGRSLTYRYAALAPVWAGAVFDTGPLSPGRTRRLASGVLRHFAARVRDPQPVGWYGEFEPIRQPYTGAGSPYWSGKGFAGLVLPADHPVWTDVEEPLAVEEGDVHVTLPVPGWLVSATAADGIVRVANHGADHAADETPATDDPHYSRHAYSTHAGPWHDGSLVDGHVALVDAEGRPSHRRPLEPVEIRGRVAVSRHRAHWPVGDPPGRSWPPRQPGFRGGPWLTTASVLRGAVEVRLARVDDAAGDGPFTLRIGGYAVAADARPETSVDGATAGVLRADGLVSTVTGLRGLPVAGVVESHGADAYGAHSAVPTVASGAPVRPGEVYAAAVVLAGAPRPPALPTVGVRDDRVVVRWPDGAEDRLRLPTRPVFAEEPGGASMHRPL